MRTMRYEQAFPLHTPPTFNQNGEIIYRPSMNINFMPGLSKRELFAALICAGRSILNGTLKDSAEFAIEQADALIDALNDASYEEEKLSYVGIVNMIEKGETK